MATVFTDVGKAFASNKFANGNNTATMKYIGWGTGAGTAAAGDTTLFTEDTTGGYARATGTQTQQTTTVTNDTYQVVGTLTAGASLTITNAGVFDATTSGNMGLKADHTGIPVLTNDSIQYTFKLKFA